VSHDSRGAAAELLCIQFVQIRGESTVHHYFVHWTESDSWWWLGAVRRRLARTIEMGIASAGNYGGLDQYPESGITESSNLRERTDNIWTTSWRLRCLIWKWRSRISRDSAVVDGERMGDALHLHA
jgi:hypothetical protein